MEWPKYYYKTWKVTIYILVKINSFMLGLRELVSGFREISLTETV